MQQELEIWIIWLSKLLSDGQFTFTLRINILNELGGRRWVFLHKLMSDLVRNATTQRELPGSRVC